MEAGRKVFLARGFHAASLDQVSAAAGLTNGAIYARFGSKAELFLALLEHHVDERLWEIQVAFNSQHAPAKTAAAVARQWMERSATHRDWSLLALEFRVYAAREPAVLKRYRLTHQRLRIGMVRAIAQAYQRAGRRPPMDPERMARANLAMGAGMALERWADPDGDYASLYAQLAAAGGRP